VATVVVGGLLLAACSPEPTPLPPAPAPVATPVETHLERQQRLDFEAAEKSYRRFNAEYERIALLGGTEKSTPELQRYATGPYLKSMLGFLRNEKRSGNHQTGRMRVAYIHRGFYSTESLRMSTCEDASALFNVARDGTVVNKGTSVEVSIEVRRIEGVWKLWDGDDQEVKSCAD
jgi:hypothetical protein